MTACNANHRRQPCAPCPCPQACHTPSTCPAWRPAASTTPTSPRPGFAAGLRGLAIHCAAVGLAAAALVFIVKTASSA